MIGKKKTRLVNKYTWFFNDGNKCLEELKTWKDLIHFST